MEHQHHTSPQASYASLRLEEVTGCVGGFISLKSFVAFGPNMALLSLLGKSWKLLTSGRGCSLACYYKDFWVKGQNMNKSCTVDDLQHNLLVCGQVPGWLNAKAI